MGSIKRRRRPCKTECLDLNTNRRPRYDCRRAQYVATRSLLGSLCSDRLHVPLLSLFNYAAFNTQAKKHRSAYYSWRTTENYVHVSNVIRLRIGQPGKPGSISRWGEYFFSSPQRPDQLWCLASLLCPMVTGEGVKRQVVKLTTQVHPVLKLRMRGSIPPFPMRLHSVVLTFRKFGRLIA